MNTLKIRLTGLGNMFKSSKKHLLESQCSYIDHFKFAIYAAFLLLIAGIASLIHACVPAFFKGTAAYIVIKLYKMRLKNHANPMYRGWLKDENHNP
jgi:hypothetical protein